MEKGEEEEGEEVKVLDQVEKTLDCLDHALDQYGETLEILRAQREDLSLKEPPLMPLSRGGWGDFLRELVSRFGTDTFTSRDILFKDRYKVSILCTKYRALQVVGYLQGAHPVKIYRIHPEVLEKLSDDKAL